MSGSQGVKRVSAALLAVGLLAGPGDGSGEDEVPSGLRLWQGPFTGYIYMAWGEFDPGVLSDCSELYRDMESWEGDWSLKVHVLGRNRGLMGYWDHKGQVAEFEVVGDRVNAMAAWQEQDQQKQGYLYRRIRERGRIPCLLPYAAREWLRTGELPDWERIDESGRFHNFDNKGFAWEAKWLVDPLRLSGTAEGEGLRFTFSSRGIDFEVLQGCCLEGGGCEIVGLDEGCSDGGAANPLASTDQEKHLSLCGSCQPGGPSRARDPADEAGEPSPGCCVKGQCVQMQPDTCSVVPGARLLEVPCAPPGEPTPGCGEEPQGACRLPSGGCVEPTNRVECEATPGPYEGTYLGEVPCPATGACCGGPEPCRTTTEEECPVGPEQRFFAGASCDDEPCATLGGCCDTTGQCLPTYPEECPASLRFVAEGCGQGCPPLGSCTLDCPLGGGSRCVPATAEACAAEDGSFSPGLACEPTECPVSPCNSALGAWHDGCGIVELGEDGGVVVSGGGPVGQGTWSCSGVPGRRRVEIDWSPGEREAFRYDERDQLLEPETPGSLPKARRTQSEPEKRDLMHLYAGEPRAVALGVRHCGPGPVSAIPLVYAGEDGVWTSRQPDWLEVEARRLEPSTLAARRGGALRLILTINDEAGEADWVRIRPQAPRPGVGAVDEIFLQARVKRIEVTVDPEPEEQED